MSRFGHFENAHKTHLLSWRVLHDVTVNLTRQADGAQGENPILRTNKN